MEKTNLIAVAAVVLLGGFVVGRIDGKGKGARHVIWFARAP